VTYQVNISLFEALCGVKVNVLTLDNRTVVVDLHHVTPDTVKILPGEGMINAKVLFYLM
jgi:DnaJ-class molecular chaperone